MAIKHGLILGDSGYTLSNYLITPYDNPRTQSQRRFNRSQKSSRCSVERSFGQLQGRFPCLRYGLRVDPEKACKIIGACTILHNIAKIRNEEPFEEIYDEEFECEPYNGNINERYAVRDHIAQSFF